MAVLNKSQITKPYLPKETVTVAELGGDVVVTGLLLRDRLELSQNEGARFGRVAEMLARTVVDNEGNPIFTVSEWEVFGAVHSSAAFNLFAVAQRLMGGESAEKKETAPS